jgi:hypothetical protein
LLSIILAAVNPNPIVPVATSVSTPIGLLSDSVCVDWFLAIKVAFPVTVFNERTPCFLTNSTHPSAGKSAVTQLLTYVPERVL